VKAFIGIIAKLFALNDTIKEIQCKECGRWKRIEMEFDHLCLIIVIIKS
jgi:hypothetical protein